LPLKELLIRILRFKGSFLLKKIAFKEAFLLGSGVGKIIKIG
jgi:hypothetical protein